MPNIPVQHKTIQIQHKTQTRANDCWYACIQMLRTYRAGKKSKPDGAGVRAHRNEKMLFHWELVWGHKLGENDPQFKNILKSNNLIDVGGEVPFIDVGYIQDALNKHGPLMVLGDFCSIGVKEFGHWVVITGTLPKDKLHIHDPAWLIFRGGERTVARSWLREKRYDRSPVIANHPTAWE